MIVFSVLDRLLKDPPVADLEMDLRRQRVSRESLERQLEPAINAFRKTVKQNLEWLLNTRRIPPPPRVSLAWVKQYPLIADLVAKKEPWQGAPDDQRPPLETSVYYYGLPSFAYVTLAPGAQEGDVNLLAAEIEGTIRVFEPRILDPKVTVEQMPSLSRELLFRVTGKLKIDPDPEFVQYRMLLDGASGRYQVEVAKDPRA